MRRITTAGALRKPRRRGRLWVLFNRKEFEMLVLGRKSAKSLEKKKLDQRFSSIRITVPESTTDRIIDVMLIEIRPGKDASRIGITADRDVAVSRMEIVK